LRSSAGMTIHPFSETVTGINSLLATLYESA
jgi:hypothetical protein